MAVNDAMASGLPVMATTKVGAALDLISEGRTGFVVPEIDPDALASAIDRALQSSDRLRTMSEEAQKLIEPWNYDPTLSGFYRVLASNL